MKITKIVTGILFLCCGVTAFSQKENSDIKKGNELYDQGKYSEAEIVYRKGLQNIKMTKYEIITRSVLCCSDSYSCFDTFHLLIHVRSNPSLYTSYFIPPYHTHFLPINKNVILFLLFLLLIYGIPSKKHSI